jgi:hypothetical protein
MALVMVDVDRWVPISPDYEIFVRQDELTDPGYRVRFEVSTDSGLHVRCLAPLPAGFWLRPIRGDVVVGPIHDRYDTNEFRFDTDEYESRRIPGEDHVRRIDPRSIRPPGPAT